MTAVVLACAMVGHCVIWMTYIADESMVLEDFLMEVCTAASVSLSDSGIANSQPGPINNVPRSRSISKSKTMLNMCHFVYVSIFTLLQGSHVCTADFHGSQQHRSPQAVGQLKLLTGPHTTYRIWSCNSSL